MTPFRKDVVRLGDQQWWLGVAWGIAIVVALLAVAFFLTSCTSTAMVTGEMARSSGYDHGVGVRVETVRSDGAIRPRLDAKVTTQRKFNATSGYTYTGTLGAQLHGETYFAEIGWAAYGYRSSFASGVTWATDQDSPYYRVGGERYGLLMAATYYPRSDDRYRSDSLVFDLRWELPNNMTIVIGPSLSQYDWQGGRVGAGSLTAGVGYTWGR